MNTPTGAANHTAHTTPPQHTVGAPADVLPGLRVGVDGSLDAIDLVPGVDGTCGATIREALGCRLYDVVEITSDIDMWCDDEGMPDLGDLDQVSATLNPLATLLVAEHRPIYQPYFGTVLFTGCDGEHTVGLNAAQSAQLRAKAEALAARPTQLAAFRRRIIAALS